MTSIFFNIYIYIILKIFVQEYIKHILQKKSEENIPPVSILIKLNVTRVCSDDDVDPGNISAHGTVSLLRLRNEQTLVKCNRPHSNI